MNFFKNKEALIKAMANYKQKAEWFDELASNPNSTVSNKSQQAKNMPEANRFDMRDMASMCMILFEVETVGETDKKGVFMQEVEAMVDAFRSGDMKKKKPYLDRMYDFAESFDPTVLDFDNSEDVFKALAWMSIAQAIGTKLDENKEYYKERYRETPEKKMKWRNYLTKDTAYTDLMAHDLRDHDITLDTAMTLPKVNVLYLEEDKACTAMRMRDVKAYEAKQKGEPFDEPYEINLSMDLAKFLGKDDAFFADKANGFDPEDLYEVETYNPASAISRIMRMSTTYMTFDQEYADSQGLACSNLIFIDGKTVAQIVREKMQANGEGIPDQDKFVSRCEYEFTRALLDPSRHIEYGKLVPTAEGVDVEFVPLKRNLDKVNPQEKNRSMWRRMFAWMVPIHPTSNEILDRTIAEAKANEAERHALQKTQLMNNEARQQRELKTAIDAKMIRDRRMNMLDEVKKSMLNENLNKAKPEMREHSHEELDAIMANAIKDGNPKDRMQFLIKIASLENASLIAPNDSEYITEKQENQIFVMNENGVLDYDNVYENLKVINELRNEAMKSFNKKVVSKAYELHPELKGQPLSEKQMEEAMELCQNSEELNIVNKIDSLRTGLHMKSVLDTPKGLDVINRIAREGQAGMIEIMKDDEDLRINTEMLIEKSVEALSFKEDTSVERIEKEGIDLVTSVFGEKAVNHIDILASVINSQNYPTPNKDTVAQIRNDLNEIMRGTGKDYDSPARNNVGKYAKYFDDMAAAFNGGGAFDEAGNIKPDGEDGFKFQREVIMSHVVLACAKFALEAQYPNVSDAIKKKGELAMRVIENIDPNTKTAVEKAISLESEKRVNLDLNKEFEEPKVVVEDIQKEQALENDMSRDSMDNIVRFKD